VLHNASVVPIAFKLYVPGDGIAPPTCYDNGMTQLCLTHVEMVPLNECVVTCELPEEFIILPECGTLDAMSAIDVELRFCSNTFGTRELILAADVAHVGQAIISLPISAQ